MPSRLDRRRFRLAVATGNPALVRKAAPRTTPATPHEPPLSVEHSPLVYLDGSRPQNGQNLGPAVLRLLQELGIPATDEPDDVTPVHPADVLAQPNEHGSQDSRPSAAVLRYGTYLGGSPQPEG